MKILFLGLNYAPECIGIAVYSAGLCEELAARGHDVRVVTANPYYPQWRVFDGYPLTPPERVEQGVRVRRVSIHVPRAPTGARRLLHHASFAAAALIPMLRTARSFQPDLVMTVAPSLAGAPVALLAARLAGARSWIHIQDFEVEAAVATGLLDADSMAVRAGRAVERRLIGAFDRVSTISPEMCDRLETMGVPRASVHEFRNWAALDHVRPRTTASPLREAWGITTRHVALYSGNIAQKQGIEIVVDAARRLADRGDTTFVICGEGANRAALEAAADGLTNIQFRGLQPLEALNDLLALATVHLLPQRASAADLVLPSKLTNMLASGRPTIATAAPGTGLAREVEGCGVVVPPEDPAALADAIASLLDDPARRDRYGAAARARALERWDRGAVIDGVERAMTGLAGRPATRHV